MFKSIAQLFSKFTFIVIFLLFVLSTEAGIFPVKSQSASDFDVETETGFDGHCKFGDWLPMHILLKSANSYFSGHLSIGYAQTEYLIPISLAPGAQKSVRTQIFTIPRYVNQSVLLQLIPEGDDSPPIYLESINLTCIANRLLGVITDTPSAFTALNSLQPPNSTDVILLDYETLPKNVLGLQSLDALFIANTDTSQLSSEQFEAVRSWVVQGGHLILGTGTNWQATISGFDEITPLEITSARSVNIISGFSAFGSPLDLSDIILVDGNLHPESRILLKERYPLVAQRSLGGGTVSLITFDPNISAFRNSDTAVQFYDFLLHSAPEGYDFVTIKDWNPAIEAVYLFQNQGLPSAWLVLAVLLLVVLLLGPLHFYILKKMGKPESAWYTIPMASLILTTIMVILGWRFRGTKLQVNQLAVVHQWAGDEQAYASGMVGIFSPRRDSYQVRLEAGLTPYPFVSHYHFDTPNNEWDFTQSADAFHAGTLINASEIMPLGVLGGVKALSMQSDLNLNLESSTAILSGEIQNDSEVDLENTILFYPGGFELLGAFPANSAIQIDLPIDLLSQKSSSSSSTIYSTVNNPSTYYGSLIEAEIGPSTMVAKNKVQQQLNLMEAVLGRYLVPPVGFLLVGWNDTQAPIQVSILDEAFDSNTLTAYMISLPIGTISAKEQMILPPALFNWFIPENDTSQFSDPYQMRFGYQDETEIYYKLSQPVSYSKIVELIIHLEGKDSRSDFPLDVFLWNFEQERWDKFNVRNWNDVLISDPINYVDKNITEVRIKLAENGNGGGEANVTRADISLVVEP